MRITLEVKNLKDWEILLPLLKRLKIKVVDKSIPAKQEHSNVISPQEITDNEGIMQVAGILSAEEAAVFESATKESGNVPSDFFKSAGLFQHKEIDAKTLRRQAWKLKK